MAAMNMAGKKSGEKPSNFRATCKLLSQYLKQKGSLGGLALEAMAASRPLDQNPTPGKFQTPTTMSLLPGVPAPEDEEQNTPKSMDLLPQKSIILDHKEEQPIKPSNLREVEKAQLTIFYGGKVMVFNDFPARRAKDLMLMASKESIAAQSFAFPAPPVAAAAAAIAEPTPMTTSTSGHQPPTPETGLQDPAATEAGSSDMPIARRNSLHRFLEKRKDRISTKAPYQLHAGSPPPPMGTAALARPEDSKSWLGLGREVSRAENSSCSSK